MSKSIQERLKQLENTFRACCNKLFKLIERVDSLETGLETLSTDVETLSTDLGSLTTDVDAALALKTDKILPAYSMLANNTGIPAIGQETYFRQSGMSVYTGSPTWSGGTAPSGATSHTYNWIRIGNLVTLNITLFYATTGTSNTSVVIPFLSDFPTPVKPSGLSGTSNLLYNGTGDFRQTATSSIALINTVALRSNSDNTDFEIIMTQASSSTKIAKLTIQYFTA